VAAPLVVAAVPATCSLAAVAEAVVAGPDDLSALVRLSALAAFGMAGTQAEEALQPGQLAAVAAPALLAAAAPQPAGLKTMFGGGCLTRLG